MKPAGLGLLACGVLVGGCSSILKTGDHADAELLLACQVASDGKRTSIDAGMFVLAGPAILSDTDHLAVRDPAGAPVLLRSFKSSAYRVADDTSTTTHYEALVDASAPPALGWARGDGAYRWVELAMPKPPELTYVGAPEPEIHWEGFGGASSDGPTAPPPGEKLTVFAACVEAQDIEGQKGQRGKSVQELTVEDAGVLRISTLLETPNALQGPHVLSKCARIRVSMTRSQPFSVKKLGFEESRATCQLEETRSIEFERAADVETK